MRSHVSSLIPIPITIDQDTQSQTEVDAAGSSSSRNSDPSLFIVPSIYPAKKKTSWWTRLRRRVQQRHKRVVKYGKWIAVQALLFVINFGQNELVRNVLMCICTYS